MPWGSLGGGKTEQRAQGEQGLEQKTKGSLLGSAPTLPPHQPVRFGESLDTVKENFCPPGVGHWSGWLRPWVPFQEADLHGQDVCPGACNPTLETFQPMPQCTTASVLFLLFPAHTDAHPESQHPTTMWKV